MILILFYTNLGIAIIFDFFCLQNFSKINKRTPTFIPESRVLLYRIVIQAVKLFDRNSNKKGKNSHDYCHVKIILKITVS